MESLFIAFVILLLVIFYLGLGVGFCWALAGQHHRVGIPN